MELQAALLARRMEEAAGSVRRARAIAVLTGAGVSAESGVPTFRGDGGLWRQKIAGCRPNPAHEALAQMEARCAEFLLITQNIDDLHRRAGNRRLVELHRSIWRLQCAREATASALPDVPLREIPPRCACGALLRPDVVRFGETLPLEALERALKAAETCDLFLVVGTSALVQPAASLPLAAKRHGAPVIEVNPDPTPISHLVDVVLQGQAGEALPALLAAPDAVP